MDKKIGKVMFILGAAILIGGLFLHDVAKTAGYFVVIIGIIMCVIGALLYRM